MYLHLAILDDSLKLFTKYHRTATVRQADTSLTAEMITDQAVLDIFDTFLRNDVEEAMSFPAHGFERPALPCRSNPNITF